MRADGRMKIGGVALYVRTTTDDPENSMGAQLDVLQHFARQNGMLVAKVFTQVRNHQGTIEEMIAEATGDDPPFRVILVSGRSQAQEFWRTTQQWSERLAAARVKIISVPDQQEDVPADGPLHPHAGHGHESDGGDDQESHEGHDHEDHESHAAHGHESHEGHDHEDHESHGPQGHESHEGHDHEDHESHGAQGHEFHQGHDHGGNDDHGHGHAHDHAAELREASRRSLIIALVLIGGFMVVEVVGGILSGSLALLADAGHMLTDAASIALAIFAMWIAGRPESIERTFGYQRTEVLAAAFNALSLWVIAGWIVFEAVERLLNHHTVEIEGGLMLIVGGIGLAVNVAAAFVLHAGSKHSLNVDGAFKHVLADLMGSVGVVVSGVIVLLTDWVLIDPILSVGIALLIVVSSWRLVLRSVNVLLGGVPGHIDLYALCADIEDVPGVTLIHDVHVFTVTSNSEFMTAHVLMDPSYTGDVNRSLDRMRNIASEKYGIHHVTLQLCRTAGGCPENHHVGHLEAVARPSR